METFLYLKFCVSLLLHSTEFAAYLAVFFLLLLVWNGFHQISNRYGTCHKFIYKVEVNCVDIIFRSFVLGWRCLLMSNCAMLSVIPAMVWYDTWKGIYLQLPWLLVLTLQTQIFRGVWMVFFSIMCNLHVNFVFFNPPGNTVL